MDLTAALVALAERTEPDPGPEPGTTDHTDDELGAASSRLARISGQWGRAHKPQIPRPPGFG